MKQVLGWLLVGVIAIGAGFYIYTDIFYKPEQKSIQSIQGPTLDKGRTLNKKENQYEIEVVPIENKSSVNIPIPDLNKPIVFSSDISDEEKKKRLRK